MFYDDPRVLFVSFHQWLLYPGIGRFMETSGGAGADTTLNLPMPARATGNVYLHAFETGSELRAGLSRWIGYYNAQRPHSSLAGRTPDEAYGTAGIERLAA